jgi:hypothetical protein
MWPKHFNMAFSLEESPKSSPAGAYQKNENAAVMRFCSPAVGYLLTAAQHNGNTARLWKTAAQHNSSTAAQRNSLMLIKSCTHCKFHEIKQGENGKTSYCARENCFSRYSKCVATKALNQYLEQESPQQDRPFSAIDHFYSRE